MNRQRNRHLTRRLDKPAKEDWRSLHFKRNSFLNRLCLHSQRKNGPATSSSTPSWRSGAGLVY